MSVMANSRETQQPISSLSLPVLPAPLSRMRNKQLYHQLVPTLGARTPLGDAQTGRAGELSFSCALAAS